MDIASIIGLLVCGVLVILGILWGKWDPALLSRFWSFSSVLITFGGSFFSVFIMSQNPKTFLQNLKSITLIFATNASNEEEIIREIIKLSNVARKEGLLALEEAANGLDDEFMKKGVLLIIDGTDPELVRGILETELDCIESRHAGTIGFWESLAAMGPAWGMIGTLIGLINMLSELDDVSTVGPNMAIALITTFYGAMLANWICTPIATKLKANNARERTMKEVMVEGLLAIQAGENPRVIEEKLKSFLSPARREALKEEGGEELG